MSHTLILGGGPAGSAAALHLARGGHAVTLVDRDATPRHKVCGEFLSTEALDLLARLGIHPELHDALNIHTIRLASAHHVTEARLPFTARSFPRLCLDPLLLTAAEQAGAHILRGFSVESLTHDAGMSLWQARLSIGTTLTATHVVLATGKHDLRGFPRPSGPQNDLVALKMYFQLTPAQGAALTGSVELLLHPHAYTGLQVVPTLPETRVAHSASQAVGEPSPTANLTALVRRQHLNRIGGYLNLLEELQRTNPHAAERLAGAIPLLPKPLALSAIPYGFVRREALAPTLYAVGDQAAVIPSFTGDGMSIALYTGIRAAEAILREQPATTFQPQLSRQLRAQVARATVLSRALVHPAGSRVLAAAAHLWPGSLRHAAALTRLPKSAHG